MTTTTKAKAMELAMSAAREYRRIREREGQSAKTAQIRDDIEGWVGRWTASRKLVLPVAVRREMGLDA